MFSEEKTLVRRINHYSIFIQSRLFQVVEHLTYALIHSLYARQIILHIAVVFVLYQLTARQFPTINHKLLRRSRQPFCQRIGRKSRRRRKLQVIVGKRIGKSHLVVFQRRFTRCIVVPECFRQRERSVLVLLAQVGTRLERTMRSLVLTHHEERLVLGSVFNEFYRLVGNQIGSISAFIARSAVFGVHYRVIVLSLSGEYLPVVETCGIGREMPFAYHGCGIARLLQQFRERLLAAVELVENRHAVHMAVLPG